jgi:hypothetical protein
MIVNRLLSIAAAIALIALGGTARAAILTAGPAYGGPGLVNMRVDCRLFNTGTTEVTISSREIWSNSTPVGQLRNTCAGALAPGKSCVFFLEIQGPTTGDRTDYTCRAVTNGIDNNVSGTIQIYTKQVLATMPMRK